MAIGLRVDSIFGIDQKKNTFYLKYKLMTTWRDCRTVHNCSWAQLDSNHPEFHNFWIPQFHISEAQEELPSMRTDHISIDPDGMVVYESGRVSLVSCPFDLTEFPFDVQTCKLTFTVLGYPTLAYVWDPLIDRSGIGIRVENVTKSGEFAIKDWRTSLVSFPQPPPEPPYRTAAQAQFSLKRNPNVQIRAYVWPTMSFWFASWCGLWIDCSAVPARAAMGAIPLLILINKMNALVSSLPAMSETNALERYMLWILALLCLHVLEFSVVNYALRREREIKAAKGDEEIGAAAADSANRCMNAWVRKTDWCVVNFLNRNLNMHTRWISVAIFVPVTILVQREL